MPCSTPERNFTPAVPAPARGVHDEEARVSRMVARKKPSSGCAPDRSKDRPKADSFSNLSNTQTDLVCRNDHFNQPGVTKNFCSDPSLLFTPNPKTCEGSLIARRQEECSDPSLNVCADIRTQEGLEIVARQKASINPEHQRAAREAVDENPELLACYPADAAHKNMILAQTLSSDRTIRRAGLESALANPELRNAAIVLNPEILTDIHEMPKGDEAIREFVQQTSDTDTELKRYALTVLWETPSPSAVKMPFVTFDPAEPLVGSETPASLDASSSIVSAEKPSPHIPKIPQPPPDLADSLRLLRRLFARWVVPESSRPTSSKPHGTISSGGEKAYEVRHLDGVTTQDQETLRSFATLLKSQSELLKKVSWAVTALMTKVDEAHRAAQQTTQKAESEIFFRIRFASYENPPPKGPRRRVEGLEIQPVFERAQDAPVAGPGGSLLGGISKKGEEVLDVADPYVVFVPLPPGAVLTRRLQDLLRDPLTIAFKSESPQQRTQPIAKGEDTPGQRDGEGDDQPSQDRREGRGGDSSGEGEQKRDRDKEPKRPPRRTPRRQPDVPTAVV